MFWFQGQFFFLYGCFLFSILLRGQCQVLSTKQEFRNMVDKDRIRQNLRRFTKRPHPTASKGEEIISNYLRDTWKSYGFEVEEPEYEIILSIPPEDKPNKVSIINNVTGEVEWEVIGQKNITAGRGHDGTIYKFPYYFSGVVNGTIEGELVFADAGKPYQMQELKDRGISVKGKIILLLNLKSDLFNVMKEGAAGAIIFYDPYYSALEGTGVNNTYPNTIWMPGDSTFGGGLSGNIIYGDVSTPLLPSTCGMARLDDNEIRSFLPMQPIPYDDARYLLSRMQGELAPDSMKGKLNVDYRLGPGLKPTKDNPSPVLRLEVNNQYVTKKVRNVIATIPGSEEPDRYVLIGNHKDAVSFGGSDASLGTAVLMEISRIFWKLRQKGWRPRRTIKLCTWTAEEDGLIGSTEWIQENLELLQKRAVAYLNIDNTVMVKDFLNVQSSPLLSDVIFNNAKELQDPANSSITLFESMLKSILPKSKDYPGEPYVHLMDLPTDHIPFLHLLGLPVADFIYFLEYDNKRKIYPIYHTQYDTFEWVERFADPNFLYSRLIARLLGGILLDLSDSELLPFNVTKFAKSVQNAFDNLEYSHSKRLDEMQMVHLKRAIKSFVNVSNAFESAKSKLTGQQKNPLVLRMLNDQMSGLEKTFFSPNALRGLLGDQNARIVKDLVRTYRDEDNIMLFSESFYNIYKIARNEIANLTQSEKDEYLKFEMSLIIQAVRDATNLLKPLKY